MAHYAFLDSNSIVTNVIVGKDETEDLPTGFSSWENFYANEMGQNCRRTSYNTYGNEHKEGGTAFRGNYAGKGFYYDAQNDVFIQPQPYPSWTLNETTWLWEAPIDYPDDDKGYYWNENAHLRDITAGWELLEVQE
tara:strand:- start:314 stop:721 length:408 start_codon:yes stop_codon:yes gene_type:complete